MSGVEPNRISESRFNQAVSESVNFASSIQPHGLLCLLREPDWVVQQVSANLHPYFALLPQQILGQPLSNLLDEDAIAALQQAVTQLDQGDGRGKAALHLSSNRLSFTAMLHRSDNGLILELEPVQSCDIPPLSLYTAVNQTIAQLRQVPDLTEFLQLAALQLRQFTGFDRVVIYQFDAQGAGEVVAEAKHPDLPTYLGLHYPATDIPEPVRTLYRQGMVRYIPDLQAPPVGLIPDQPLDLNLAVLRGVDACCVEYHCNMGLAAILVMALVQGETLWGLISCHHRTPKFVAFEVRESCAVLAQLIASELAHKGNIAEFNYLNKLRSLQSEFIQSITQADDFRQALVHPAPRLLDLVGAQGAAICLDDDITLVGTTPSQAQVQMLLHWLETERPQISSASSVTHALFHTDSLPKLYAEAVAFKDSASGLLMLQISRVRRYSILWFRPEVLQTINWAGNPDAALSVAADGTTVLCPRTSFEQWQEIVRFTALPWKACELESALDLRSAIVGIVLKKADELAKINQELERSVRELDSFAYAASHDLKEPLRGIHNFSNLLLKGYADVLDEVGQSRLQTLLRLTRRMEALIDALLKFSRLGHTELHRQPTDLNQSLQQVLDDLQTSRPDLQTEIRVPRPLPTVVCDPILVEEVLANLISNAVKYTDKPQPWIEIGFLEADEQQPDVLPHFIAPTNLLPLTLYVRDNGIGIRERHLNSVFRLFKRLHEQHLYGGGTGAGLAITKKIIERHGGQIWVTSTHGEGSTFYFTLESSGTDAAL